MNRFAASTRDSALKGIWMRVIWTGGVNTAVPLLKKTDLHRKAIYEFSIRWRDLLSLYLSTINGSGIHLSLVVRVKRSFTYKCFHFWMVYATVFMTRCQVFVNVHHFVCACVFFYVFIWSIQISVHVFLSCGMNLMLHSLLHFVFANVFSSFWSAFKCMLYSLFGLEVFVGCTQVYERKPPLEFIWNTPSFSVDVIV